MSEEFEAGMAMGMLALVLGVFLVAVLAWTICFVLTWIEDWWGGEKK